MKKTKVKRRCRHIWGVRAYKTFKQAGNDMYGIILLQCARCHLMKDLK